MSRRATRITSLVILVLTATVGVLGYQAHRLNWARENALVAYYDLGNRALFDARVALHRYLEGGGGSQLLRDADAALHNYQESLLPLTLYLVPRRLRSSWHEYGQHHFFWNARQVIHLLIDSEELYYGQGGLPEQDIVFLERLHEEIIALSDIVRRVGGSFGAQPKLAIGREQLNQMNEIAARISKLSESYYSNGLLPEELPAAALTMAQAEEKALEFARVSFPDEEWQVYNSYPVTVLRQGADFYQFSLQPRRSASPRLDVRIGRQTGELVSFIFWGPGQGEVDEQILLQWAEAATSELPGDKIVVDVDTQVPYGEGQARVVVTPSRQGVPVFSSRAAMHFDPSSGKLLLWVNYTWDATEVDTVPTLTEAQATEKLLQRFSYLDPDAFKSFGLAIDRSGFSNEPILVYRFVYREVSDGFRYDVINREVSDGVGYRYIHRELIERFRGEGDEESHPYERVYLINAHTGQYEGSGSAMR